MKKGMENKHIWGCCCSGGMFWGILFLIIGVWFLAKDLGYIDFSVSIWPVVLIVLGLWFLLKRNKC